MVAKARRILDAPALPRAVKTDCLLTQRLPKRFAERLRALEALRHPDGAPVHRVRCAGRAGPSRPSCARGEPVQVVVHLRGKVVVHEEQVAYLLEVGLSLAAFLWQGDRRTGAVGHGQRRCGLLVWR